MPLGPRGKKPCEYKSTYLNSCRLGFYDLSMTEEKRLLTRQEAAAYCGLEPSAFSLWVANGTMPKPVAGSRRWDKRAIDAKLDAIAGLKSETTRQDDDDAMEREFYRKLNERRAKPETALEKWRRERDARRAATGK